MSRSWLAVVMSPFPRVGTLGAVGRFGLRAAGRKARQSYLGHRPLTSSRGRRVVAAQDRCPVVRTGCNEFNDFSALSSRGTTCRAWLTVVAGRLVIPGSQATDSLLAAVALPSRGR